MKEEQQDEDQVPAEATRRRFLRFLGMAGALPSAAFLQGCASTPEHPSGAKGGMRRDPLKGGPQVTPKHIKDFSQANTVPKQIKWDFDRLIVDVERYLEKKENGKYKDEDKAKKKYEYKKGKKKKWKLKIDPPRDNKERIVAVEVTSLEFEAAANEPTKIGKMRIKGRMERNRDGTPYEKTSKAGRKIRPYYSSSLSSWSSWA